MQAIEFDAVVQAHAIPLPKPVALASGLSVRVVVMYEGAEPLPATANQGNDVSRRSSAQLLPDAPKNAETSLNEAALLAQITRAPAAGALSAAQLPTAGFRFDREEANER